LKGDAFMALLGNPSLSGAVTVFDASMTQSVYAAKQGGSLINNLVTREQRTAMDVTGDGAYDSSDTSFILGYVLYRYNEGSMDFADWYAAGRPSYDA
jgi:hypothetical protein